MKFFKKKCVVCNKKIEKGIEKHDQRFCSEQCLKKFEENFKEMEKINLDDCC